MKFLRPKFKKLKNKKFSKFTIWHYILIISISTLLFVGVILFFYQYILGVSESNDSDVLQARTVGNNADNTTEDVQEIEKYRIEFVDTDNKRKSIRPKDCYAFDDVEYGVTSFMKRICRRNFFAIDDFKDSGMSITNNFGGTIKPNQVIDDIYRDPSRLNDRIVPPSLDLMKSQPGLTDRINPTSTYARPASSPFRFDWVSSGQFVQFYIADQGPLRLTFLNNESERWFSTLISYPSNKLTGAGNTTFVYFGGSGLTGQSLKDTYIFREEKEDFNRNSVLSSAHLTAVDKTPVMIYYGGVYGIDRRNNEVYLITRLWDSDYYFTKACKTFKTPKVVYRIKRDGDTFLYFRNVIDNISDNTDKCFANGSFKGPNWQDCQDVGLNLTTPEIFKDTLTQVTNGKRNQAWSSDMRCADFSKENLSYQEPELNEVRLNTDSEGRVKLISKRSILAGVPRSGFAFKERISCLGISDNDKCIDIVESLQRTDSHLSARSVTTSKNNYASDNKIDSFVTSNICNNWSSCSKMPLIKNTQKLDSAENNITDLHPFTNETGGYELPKRWYDFGIRAVELKANTSFSYTDPYQKSGRAPITVRSGGVPSKIDYAFSDEFSMYGIELKSNFFVLYQFNMPVKGELHISSIASPVIPQNIFKKENITVTFSKIQEDAANNRARISVLFSDKFAQAVSEYRLFEVYTDSPTDCPPNSDGTTTTCSVIGEIKNVYLNNSPTKAILNLKYFPQPGDDNDELDYVYLTSEKVYFVQTLKLWPRPPQPPIVSNCQIPQTAVVNITNTSPNSNLTTSWSLSYNETVAKRLIVNVGATSTTPITCNGQRITGATISLSRIDSPSNIITFTATGNTATPQNNTLVFGAPNLPTIPSNMDYQIRSLNLTIGNQVVTLTPTSHPNLFGTRGWDIYTENIVRVRIANSPQPFPLTISVDKYRSSSPVAIRNFPNLSVNNVFDIFSNNIPGFFYDGEYTSSLDNFYYDMCFPPSLTISSFSSNNTNIELSRNGLSCLRFRSKPSSRGVPQEVTISLASSTSGSPSKEIWNGNLYIKNATGVSMLQKPANAKFFEGILYSNEANNNSWSRYVKETKFFPSYFKENQVSLQGFFASSSLNLGVNGSEFYLLRDPSSPVEGTGTAFPAGNYVTLSDPNSSTKDFHIIAVSKGRGISFNLTNSFLVNQKIDNFAFVNMSGNQPERIRFFADCSNANYSYICGNQFKYIFRAPIYGSYIVDFRNAPSNSGSNLVITENPDLLMQLIPVIRSKKMNLVTTTFININYLD